MISNYFQFYLFSLTGESKTSLEPWKIALISCCIVSIAVALIGVYFWRWRITRNNNDDRANDNQNKEVSSANLLIKKKRFCKLVKNIGRKKYNYFWFTCTTAI